MFITDYVLVVCAVVCFLLAAFGVPRVRWDALGFAFLAATLLN